MKQNLTKSYHPVNSQFQMAHGGSHGKKPPAKKPEPPAQTPTAPQTTEIQPPQQPNQALEISTEQAAHSSTLNFGIGEITLFVMLLFPLGLYTLRSQLQKRKQ